MSRNALYFAILTVLAAFLVGLTSGVVFSSRINTSAVEAYRQSMDRQIRLAYASQIDDQRVWCQDQLAIVHGQLRDAQRAGVNTAAELTATADSDRRAYSERILWLQAQLRVHGIAEAIVKP